MSESLIHIAKICQPQKQGCSYYRLKYLRWQAEIYSKMLKFCAWEGHTPITHELLSLKGQDEREVGEKDRRGDGYYFRNILSPWNEARDLKLTIFYDTVLYDVFLTQPLHPLNTETDLFLCISMKLLVKKLMSFLKQYFFTQIKFKSLFQVTITVARFSLCL